jgi:cadmium resistance protein CadD (predicted permease)
LLASAVPVQYLGLLGLVPISIGAVGLFRLSRGPAAANDSSHEQTASAAAVFAATLFTQLGNSTDTLLTFGPLFADSMRAASYMIMFTVAVMGALLLFAANYFVKHPLLSDPLQRHAHRVTPFVLIFVGLYILANTATDLVPD